MKFLVSCIPYDDGKSGISVYVRGVISALLEQGHELTLFCEPGTNGEAFGLGAKISSVHRVFAPRWTRRPVFSMVWRSEEHTS
ncbi:MAG: hypothetical protein IKR48_03075, partial [Kiritimatiellae bacterium]|nr:hypothetical protein [Kiritimatiellia bacterium]